MAWGASGEKQDMGKTWLSLLNAFHVLPFTAAYQHINPRPSSAISVAKQQVLLSDMNVFHHQPHCTATGICSEPFPCVLCPTFLCPWCAATGFTDSCRADAGQNPLASPLKELWPWSKIKYFCSVEETRTNRKIEGRSTCFVCCHFTPSRLLSTCAVGEKLPRRTAPECCLLLWRPVVKGYLGRPELWWWKGGR